MHQPPCIFPAVADSTFCSVQESGVDLGSQERWWEQGMYGDIVFGCSFAGFYSNLLRYDLHRVKCMNLKYTAWCLFPYQHICDHHLDKDLEHFHHLRSSYCPSPKRSTGRTSINID